MTTESQPDHSQLVLQATTISDLMFYQNFLTQRAEEDRSRWESEKDGWLRIAKALTAQRNKAGNSTVKDEVSRFFSDFICLEVLPHSIRNWNVSVPPSNLITAHYATRFV